MKLITFLPKNTLTFGILENVLGNRLVFDTNAQYKKILGNLIYDINYKDFNGICNIHESNKIDQYGHDLSLKTTIELYKRTDTYKNIYREDIEVISNLTKFSLGYKLSVNNKPISSFVTPQLDHNSKNFNYNIQYYINKHKYYKENF